MVQGCALMFWVTGCCPGTPFKDNDVKYKVLIASLIGLWDGNVNFFKYMHFKSYFSFSSVFRVQSYHLATWMASYHDLYSFIAILDCMLDHPGNFIFRSTPLLWHFLSNMSFFLSLALITAQTSISTWKGIRKLVILFLNASMQDSVIWNSMENDFHYMQQYNLYRMTNKISLYKCIWNLYMHILSKLTVEILYFNNHYQYSWFYC
jgi:hypothetical protein